MEKGLTEETVFWRFGTMVLAVLMVMAFAAVWYQTSQIRETLRLERDIRLLVERDLQGRPGRYTTLCAQPLGSGNAALIEGVLTGLEGGERARHIRLLAEKKSGQGWVVQLGIAGSAHSPVSRLLPVESLALVDYVGQTDGTLPGIPDCRLPKQQLAPTAQEVSAPQPVLPFTPQPAVDSVDVPTTGEAGQTPNGVWSDPMAWTLWEQAVKHGVLVTQAPQEAPAVAVLFDPTCGSCRRLWQLMDASREHWGQKLRVYWMPALLDVNQTDSLRLAVAALASPEALGQVMRGDLDAAPQEGQATEKSGDRDQSELVRRSSVLLAQLYGGAMTVPTLVFPSPKGGMSVIRGLPGKAVIENLPRLAGVRDS